MPASKERKWRFLGITTSDGAGNMSVDESILLARSQDLVPNPVRIYKWKPAAVSIGYFLKLNDVVDVAKCRRLGVDIVRRITGGGAVFHSEAEVTYSVIVKKEDATVPKDLIESYKKLSAAVASVPAHLGLEAYFEPGHPGVCPNMVVAGKKISGSAQAQKKGVILQHGTLLLDCDLGVMADVLRIPLDSIDAKVTTLRRELEKKSPQDRETLRDDGLMQDLLREGFSNSLGVQLFDGELSESEKSEVSKMMAKYSSREWTELR